MQYIIAFLSGTIFRALNNSPMKNIPISIPGGQIFWCGRQEISITVFEEEIGALEEKIVCDGRILVGKKSQNGRPEERNASTWRDLTAVAAAKRRMDQIHWFRVGNFRVEVDVFVTAPKETIFRNKNSVHKCRN